MGRVVQQPSWPVGGDAVDAELGQATGLGRRVHCPSEQLQPSGLRLIYERPVSKPLVADIDALKASRLGQSYQLLHAGRLLAGFFVHLKTRKVKALDLWHPGLSLLHHFIVERNHNQLLRFLS